jgi:hypothetical protein
MSVFTLNAPQISAGQTRIAEIAISWREYPAVI